MLSWYGPRSARVRRSAADGPTVRGVLPVGYGADGDDVWHGIKARSLGARTPGEGARLGRCAGADAEAAGAWVRRVGAWARATSRRGGALARQCVGVPLFEHEYLQKMTRSAQSFEYESRRAHLGDYFCKDRPIFFSTVFA
jgi:hypothetical protein